MSGPTAAWLADGRRLHLQHGPIDLIIEADGASTETELAYAQAIDRFQTILTELVDELPRLRTPCPKTGLGLNGPVARRMEAAVRPFSPHFVTPMAAVAGAVADEMLMAMTSTRKLDRAYVNNGGDIALFLAEDHRYDIAMVGRPDRPVSLGKIAFAAGDGIGGMATSGRHGRSHSLGIADSVTILAANAASADAAATLIANEVNLPDHPGVKRVPARDLSPDSDLGDRLVTVDVAGLGENEAAIALNAGATFAKDFVRQRAIKAAALYLADQCAVVGDFPVRQPVERQSSAAANITKGKKLAAAEVAKIRPMDPVW